MGEMITWMRGNDAWDASRGIGRMGIGRDGRTAFRVHSADWFTDATDYQYRRWIL